MITTTATSVNDVSVKHIVVNTKEIYIYLFIYRRSPGGSRLSRTILASTMDIVDQKIISLLGTQKINGV